MSIASSFSWDLQWSQEKTKTMLMQNLGGQTKSIMVFSEVAYVLKTKLCILKMASSLVPNPKWRLRDKGQLEPFQLVHFVFSIQAT